MIQSTLYGNIKHQGIDAAKTAKIDHYEKYPAVAKRIRKAIGGKRSGSYPDWFQYSKNQRKKKSDKKPKKEYDPPNSSTMNRISQIYEDVGNMNMQVVDLPAFNWQMFLSEPCVGTNNEACETFCQMDSMNLTNIIESREYDYSYEKESRAGYDLLAEMISEEMTSSYGSLEESFPFITKFLFTGEMTNKSAHKKMYWRVYGDIAVRNLRKNLKACRICPECEMKIPEWENDHSCTEEMQGFFICVDCCKRFPRMNSRQCRCLICQKTYRLAKERARQKKRYLEKVKGEAARTTFLGSSSETI